MAIVKKLSDYALRGGSGGYSVEGYPGLTVGQVNKSQESVGQVAHGMEGGKANPRSSWYDYNIAALKKYNKAMEDASSKEINAKKDLASQQAETQRKTLEDAVKNYSEVLKNLPKDKLGNTIMTPEAEALGAKVRALLQGKVGPQNGYSGNMQDYGVTPEQEAQINAAKPRVAEAAKALIAQKQQQQEPGGVAQGLTGPKAGQVRRFPKGEKGEEVTVKMGKMNVPARLTGKKRYNQTTGKQELEAIGPAGTPSWVPEEIMIPVETSSGPKSMEDYYRSKNQKSTAPFDIPF